MAWPHRQHGARRTPDLSDELAPPGSAGSYRVPGDRERPAHNAAGGASSANRVAGVRAGPGAGALGRAGVAHRPGRVEDTDYGSREYTARDPVGHVWSFGSYLPQPGSR